MIENIPSNSNMHHLAHRDWYSTRCSGGGYYKYVPGTIVSDLDISNAIQRVLKRLTAIRSEESIKITSLDDLI